MLDMKDELDRAVLPYAEAAMRWLAERYETWASFDRESDELCNLVGNALDAVIPKGDRLWALYASQPVVRLVQPPGVIADTLEEVLRDALKWDDYLEDRVWRWIDAVL